MTNQQPPIGSAYKLKEKDVQEFIGIWQESFGETLTYDQAHHEARQLIELYWILSRPLPGDKE